jgi:hypothetical protein
MTGVHYDIRASKHMFFDSSRYPTAFIREAERRSSGYDTAMEEGGLEHQSRPYGVHGMDIGDCCILVAHRYELQG